MRTVLTATLVLVMTFGLVQASFAAPALELDPNTGPAGTKGTAAGEEFSGSTVELFLGTVGTTLIGMGPIDAAGEFKVDFQIPLGTPAGSHALIACADRTGRDECRTEVAAKFVVTVPATTTTSTSTTSTTSTTTTTSPPIGVTTTTTIPGPSHPTTGDLQWTTRNPPPPTVGQFTIPTTLPPPSIAAPDGLGPDEWPDLRATAIEVTQGMQNIANDMPLVSNRRTYARVYLDVIGDVTSWAPISGVLEVWDGPQFKGQLTPENIATAWPDGGDRLELDDSLYFEIPLAWAQGTDVRFSTLVWAFNPATLDFEPDTNNVRHAFVDFHTAQPVTVHPAPLHLHRSFHPTDEIRTYTAVFGGNVYAQQGGANSGALDIVEGLWRYHPVSSVSVEPYPSVLYPLEHWNGVEWNLGPCSTTYTGEALAQINQPGWDTQPFESVLSWEPFFEDPGSIDEDDLMADFVEDSWGQWGLEPDRTGLSIMDRRYDVSRVYIEVSTGQVGISRTTTDFSGPDPIPGAPAFVSGCSPDDSDYGAPNHVMGLNRVWYDWDNETEYFLGMVDPSLPTRWGGLASSGNDAAWAKFSQDIGTVRPWSHSGARLVGHELGHLTGLKHAPCKDSDGDGIPDELAGGAIDMTHPGVDWFPDCQLGEIDPEGFFGFDVYHKLWGLSEPTVISPDPASPALNLAYPLMGYLSPKWTDPYHWCRMLEHYGVPCSPNLVGIAWNPPPPEPTEGHYTPHLPPMPAPGSNRDVAIITGTLPNPDDDDEPGLGGVIIFSDINLLPDCRDCEISLLRQVPDAPGSDGPTSTQPWIEVWGTDGTLIQRMPLPVEFEHDEHHGPIDFQVPVVFEPGATIRIVGDDGAAMGETTADDVPIELVALDLVGLDPSTGVVELAGPWEDLPDDAIHTLQYSPDGDHWLALANRRGSPITEVDPEVFDRLPGSTEGRTRILISAGWSGGVVDGPNIALPNKAPVLTLQLPLDQSAYAMNELVEMAATALDPEDRNLTDQIEWTSSVDGSLGNGATAASWTLSPGEHTITASVTDSAGATSQVDVTIAVSSEMIQAVLSAQDKEIIAQYLDAAPATDEPAPATTTPGTVPEGTAAPAPPPDETPEDDGGGFPFVPMIVVLLAALGAGAFWRTRALQGRLRD